MQPLQVNHQKIYSDLKINHNLLLDYGFLLLKIGDLGPQLLVHDNLPLDLKNDLDSTVIELGLYLSLVVSQGKGMQNVGFYGPLPWKKLPNHNLLFFSFIAKDPSVKDPRKKKHGVMVFSVIFCPRSDERINKVRISLERNFFTELVEDRETLPEIIDDKNQLILKTIKSIISSNLIIGRKILQEHALDLLLTNSKIRYLGLYSDRSHEKLLPLIEDDETLYKDIISEQLTTRDEVSFRKSEKGVNIGFLRFRSYKKIVIGLFDDVTFCVEDFVQFSETIRVALPILNSYIEL
jgi:hypothetical protein